MSDNKPMKLRKDLIIPAGTVFSQAPSVTQRDKSFGQAVIGLTPDTFGTVEYSIWGDDKERIAEWFEPVTEKQTIVEISPNAPNWLLTANAIAEDPGSFIYDSTPKELCEFVGNLAKKIVELGEEAKRNSVNELIAKHPNLHTAVSILLQGILSGKSNETISKWDSFRSSN